MGETLWNFITHGCWRSWIVITGILISVSCFTISVLKDKKDDLDSIDQEFLQHTKTFKLGLLSIAIGILICIGIDFSGGIELGLTGFGFIFLRQSLIKKKTELNSLKKKLAHEADHSGKT